MKIYVFGFLFVTMLYILVSCSSSPGPTGGGGGSSSSIVPNASVAGSWYITNITGTYTNSGQITFYIDGVFSDSSGYGNWTISGNSLTMFYHGATNQYSWVINGNKMISTNGNYTNSSDNGMGYGIITSTNLYTHGILTFVNNTSNPFYITEWIGPRRHNKSNDYIIE